MKEQRFQAVFTVVLAVSLIFTLVDLLMSITDRCRDAEAEMFDD